MRSDKYLKYYPYKSYVNTHPPRATFDYSRKLWRLNGGSLGAAAAVCAGPFSYLVAVSSICWLPTVPFRESSRPPHDRRDMPCLLSAVFGGRRGHGLRRPAEDTLSRTNMGPSSWFSYLTNTCQLPGYLPAGSAGFFFACPS